MEMPRPTAEHRVLERLAGEWIGTETLHPSPFDPGGGTAVGRVVNRPSLDGFALVQDYEQERGGRVTFRGHGVFRYDVEAREYVLHWFDSTGMRPDTFRGGFHEDTLTLTTQGPMGHIRASWNLRDADAIVYRMHVSGDGTSWEPFMEGTYTRAGSHA
jgi:hypothetical protein